jgi:protein disulfide-isomerase A1
VTIAKVDATTNDVPDEVAGFPTIKLFPAGAKSDPITYSGSRTVEDLATFVKENGKHKVDAYVANDTEEAEMPDAEEMGKQAPAATEKAKSATEKAKSAGEKVKEKASEGVGSKVKSVVSEAAEAVKTAVADTDSDGVEHDEL